LHPTVPLEPEHREAEHGPKVGRKVTITLAHARSTGEHMTAANRGKGPEGHVKAFLQAYSAAHATFDFERKHDAHSAGGRFQRQTYDFAWFTPGRHGGIEVKEVKHDFRIPYGNFGSDQVGALYKRALAGGYVTILVFHSTTSLWRICPLAPFRTREEGKGSWDLSIYPQYPSCTLALNATTYFPNATTYFP
jgi:penicillin-binding protein-related factor A (putative recombinase)